MVSGRVARGGGGEGLAGGGGLPLPLFVGKCCLMTEGLLTPNFLLLSSFFLFLVPSPSLLFIQPQVPDRGIGGKHPPPYAILAGKANAVRHTTLRASSLVREIPVCQFVCKCEWHWDGWGEGSGRMVLWLFNNHPPPPSLPSLVFG